MNTKFLRLIAESQGDDDDARSVFWACDEIDRLTEENEARTGKNCETHVRSCE